jgi:adenine-specific DNA-methyltransferase
MGIPGYLTAAAPENEEYLSRQLITYIGNKRNLLGFIGLGLDWVKKRLNREKLLLLDLFSGSGVVARFFKAHAGVLWANDLEPYAETINRCYLANKSELPLAELGDRYGFILSRLEQEPLRRGFLAELYAPRDDREIRDGERVFYTSRNASYLDTARQYIEDLDTALRPFFLAPLLAEASVHANTAGVFKGFYKDRATGRGRYGGAGDYALNRIKGNIALPFPVWSNFECPVHIYRKDANLLAEEIDEVDLAYLDPPYNQHPYGSNYFMLNLIQSYKRPELLSPVSGIPAGWNHSRYNKKGSALQALTELVEKIKAKFLLISFNSEGFIGSREMKSLLEKNGKVVILETPYNTFRGSRNLKKRRLHVKEYLFLLEK